MTTIEVRLDSLRTAATELQQASRAITDAVEAVQAEVTALYGLGLPAGGVGAFSVSYAANGGAIQEWPFKLVRFASNLEQAADDIQQAMNQPARTMASLVLPFIPESVCTRCAAMKTAKSAASPASCAKRSVRRWPWSCRPPPTRAGGRPRRAGGPTGRRSSHSLDN